VSVLGPQIEMVRGMQTRRLSGTVVAVRGLSVLVDDLPLPVGALVRLVGDEDRAGEVIGFDGPRSVIMLLAQGAGVAPGMRAVGEQSARVVPVGGALLGRVIDGLGRPIDGGPMVRPTVNRALEPPPLNAMRRRPISAPLPTGVRAIDAMLTLGRGQRVGIFSGPGVGKSTLLATVARNTAADVNVIALVGERGREVREFIDRALGEEARRRSVIVVATGDESPLLRVRAALAACSVAEHFRDQGADVMLMMDSISRFAQAQRQIGLTAGEPPATRGFTPSVFALLPRVVERAGAIESGGSITGLYTVLVEGDDLTEPISDAVRGLLDGHVVLSRRLAGRGHHPALDVLQSVSRVADTVCDRHHVAARQVIGRLLSAHAEAEELITIGAYAAGADPDVDVAVAMKQRLEEFLRQEPAERADYPTTCRRLIELAALAQVEYGKRKK
jgi:flagellum-specific ATP synthase